MSDLPPDQAAEAGSQHAGARFLHYISTFGAPSAVAAGLLFYFGWVRAHAQAEALGYDVAIAGLSNADYVLRSVPALFLPLLSLVVAALVALRLDTLLIGWVRRCPHGRAVGRLIRVLRWAVIGIPVIGLLTIGITTIGEYATVPFTLTLGVLAYLYSVRLTAATGTERDRGPVWRPLLLLLLVMLLFWDVERTAHGFGESFADLIVSRPDRYFPVAIYSKDDLELEYGLPVVTEQRIGADGSAYRFRYDGLRLLNYSSKKYFLLAPRPGDEDAVVLVLPDVDSVRVVF